MSSIRRKAASLHQKVFSDNADTPRVVESTLSKEKVLYLVSTQTYHLLISNNQSPFKNRKDPNRNDKP